MGYHVEAGEGYRILGKSEPVQEGDEYTIPEDRSRVWCLSGNWRAMISTQQDGGLIYRRKVPTTTKTAMAMAMGKIDPGPGYRLLGVGEIRPAEYEAYSPTRGAWEGPGMCPGEPVHEGSCPFRVRLPEPPPGYALIPKDYAGPRIPGSLYLGPWGEWTEPVSNAPTLPYNFDTDVYCAPGTTQFEAYDCLAQFSSAQESPAVDPAWIPKPFTPNKYTRDLLTLDGRTVPVDVYSVLGAFPAKNAAVDHALKKLLAPGQRGQKDRLQDLKEARQSLDRAIQMEGG
jgi:hypothetical protein